MSQTKFANNKSPWAGTAWERKSIEMKPQHPEKDSKPAEKLAASTATKAKPSVNINKLVVCDVPYKVSRSPQVNPVYQFFDATMRVGKAIQCEPELLRNTEGALRRWAKSRGIEACTRTITRHPDDGKTYVWLLPLDKKSK